MHGQRLNNFEEAVEAYRCHVLVCHSETGINVLMIGLLISKNVPINPAGVYFEKQ